MTKRSKPDLTHVREDGEIAMVDVGGKSITDREAIAEAVVRMKPSTANLLSRKALPKGDVLATAKVAGILAAKKTSSLIPLTHPLALNYIDLELKVRPRKGEVSIRATVRCSDRTGVEIEASTAFNILSVDVNADRDLVPFVVQPVDFIIGRQHHRQHVALLGLGITNLLHFGIALAATIITALVDPRCDAVL